MNKQISALFDRIGGVYALPIILMVIALPLVGSFPTWVTLTVAGLGMGMMIFLMASGLSLVFGLMDVLNFGHSAFISFGAFIAATVLAALAVWVGADNWMLNLLALTAAVGAAMLFGLVAGWAFEAVIVKPVYSDHLRQILITIGALIVADQLVLVIWGGIPISVPKPAFLQGSFIIGDVSIEIYRSFAFLVGTIVFTLLYLVLNRTRLGLLIRAGVENREMVEALGFRIGRLFVLVFVVGSALAAMGGAMWGGYQGLISGELGSQVMILVFIVVIIGGLGSIEGSLLGALLVGLLGNYVAFIFPKLSLASNMLLMMVILLWRPYGLKPAIKR
ncbi:MAG: branched-chain amino acid ABC transporter permease [Hyphomicrobiaceae bacterium]|nr:branched-chain amino acid ABC transporter permease [Hyphomicrobiaceae bacterium]MCC0023128.1 branched-chain amino acid ABC transporter permease [Hyphomicrobiaceae bacterium]